jgi:hypothetical protein
VANLANEEESNINGEELDKKLGILSDADKTRENVKFELTHYFIIGLLAAVFLELLWIKFRGDL